MPCATNDSCVLGGRWHMAHGNASFIDGNMCSHCSAMEKLSSSTFVGHYAEMLYMNKVANGK